MENKKKGGRPPKRIKRKSLIGVVCNTLEYKLIDHNSKAANTTKSEFLRDLGTRAKVITKVKTLPREVLKLSAQLSMIASLLNQLCKSHHLGILNQMDRITLLDTIEELKSAIQKIKQA